MGKTVVRWGVRSEFKEQMLSLALVYMWRLQSDDKGDGIDKRNTAPLIQKTLILGRIGSREVEQKAGLAERRPN